MESLEEGQDVAPLPSLPEVRQEAQGLPLEPAAAVGDDPMLQVAGLGDTGTALVAKRKRVRREKVRPPGHVHSLELLERLGQPQLHCS